MLGYRGTFDIASSADYQVSYGTFFIDALIDEVLLQNTPATWKEVFDTTQRLVMEKADGYEAVDKRTRRALAKEGRTVGDLQQSVAFALPEPA